MNNTDRRVFLLRAAACAPALLVGMAHAQAPNMVGSSDRTAQALGYLGDATRVDTRRFPRYTAGQRCDTCQLYAGKPGDAAGACGIFPGKMVAAGGWCSAYGKKD